MIVMTFDAYAPDSNATARVVQYHSRSGVIMHCFTVTDSFFYFQSPFEALTLLSYDQMRGVCPSRVLCLYNNRSWFKISSVATKKD